MLATEHWSELDALIFKVNSIPLGFIVLLRLTFLFMPHYKKILQFSEIVTSLDIHRSSCERFSKKKKQSLIRTISWL